MAELGCLSISTTVFVSRRRGRAQREEESGWNLQGLAGCTASSLDARDRERNGVGGLVILWGKSQVFSQKTKRDK